MAVTMALRREYAFPPRWGTSRLTWPATTVGSLRHRGKAHMFGIEARHMC